jgi:poly-beta-1,6-N-acetyl-D-glucosamine synthase
VNNYVLISAVKDEGKFIEETFASVINQILLPSRWIIVDDNSCDNTYNILMRLSKGFGWIQLYKLCSDRTRTFSSQVFAQMYGVRKLIDRNFDFIGFLDGDLRLPADYYEKMIVEMNDNSKVGIIGGAVEDVFSKIGARIRRGSEDYHVAGGVQFFRKECFFQIDGYKTIPLGGQDTVAEIEAMKLGWKVKTVSTVKAEHLKMPLNQKNMILRSNYVFSRHAYNLGYSKTYFFLYALRRIFEKPSMIDFMLRISFFLIIELVGPDRPIAVDLVKEIQKIQKDRIINFAKKFTV